MTLLPNGAPLAAIPEPLRQRDQWVLFTADKTPYTDLRREAKANNPQTWLPFAVALERWRANPNGWAGIGYEFSADDPYTGIDLDACLDPATGIVEPWADKELELLLPTFADISPSDTGIKLWVETEKPHTLGSVKDIHEAGGVEVYSSGKYFTVTGRAFEDAPPTIAKVDDAIIEQIIAREQTRRAARRAQQRGASSNGTKPQNTSGAVDLTKINSAYPPLSVPELTRILDRLSADRWANYDDWYRIGMAMHHWADGDAHRCATARALYDQYSKERAPDVYGQVEEKWASFGKRDGDAPNVTVGTLIAWAREDADSTTPAAPARPQCTDYGNARRMVEQHGDDLRYVKEWGWLTWDGRRWELDRTGEADRRAKATALSIYQEAAEAPEHLKKDLARHAIASQSSGKITSMLALAESEAELRAQPSDFDTNDWLLTCINGTLDLRTGQLEPHDRRNMLTRAIDVVYDAEARCPGWLAFLDRIFAGDSALIAYVQRMVGYMLTGSTGAQCMFIAYGTGANGKSVLIEVIRALLGEYARNADASTFTAQQSDRIRSDLARLAGVRFVSTVELDEGRRLSEALVKQIAGGDVITARFLHKDEFEFKPRFKLLLATNHKPIIRGTDYAIWRRIRLIPFTVTIPEDERDPLLADKLQQELAGILAWAVQGCLDWQQHGLQEPNKVKDATSDYRSEMDVIGQYLGERCILKGQVQCATLYTNYVKWCEESGERAVNQRRFGAQMTERGIERVRSTGGWRYVGVSIGAEDVDLIDPIDPISPIPHEENFTSDKTGIQDQLDQLDQSPVTPDPAFRVVGGPRFAEARARAANQRSAAEPAPVVEWVNGLPDDYEEL